MNLLLLDDDVGVARGLALVARSGGHGLHHATTVADAAAFLDAHPVDVFLTDLRLPGGESGLTALGHCRAAHPQVVRILMTGAATVMAASPDGLWQIFIAKPFGVAAFLGLLDRARALQGNGPG